MAKELRGVWAALALVAATGLYAQDVAVTDRLVIARECRTNRPTVDAALALTMRSKDEKQAISELDKANDRLSEDLRAGKRPDAWKEIYANDALIRVLQCQIDKNLVLAKLTVSVSPQPRAAAPSTRPKPKANVAKRCPQKLKVKTAAGDLVDFDVNAYVSHKGAVEVAVAELNARIRESQSSGGELESSYQRILHAVQCRQPPA